MLLGRPSWPGGGVMGVSMSCSCSLVRCTTEPILCALISLASLFLLLDLQLCLQLLLPSSDTSQLTVKGVMQAPTVHYLELPLAEVLEQQLSLSLLLTPNMVSLLGVLLGLAAALLIGQTSSHRRLLGVLCYKARDLADSLDGVVARGPGARALPTPGTQGYYVDGWCDVASDTALLLAVGWLLSRQERTRERLLPLVREDKERLLPLVREDKERLLPVELRLLPVEERLLPVEEKLLPAKERLSPGVHWPWLAVLLLGLQAVVASIGWNYTTQQLSSLLETPGAERPDIFRWPATVTVMYLWRLGNPHMLSQALLVSLALGRTRQWVLLARLLLFLPILLTCLVSFTFVSYLCAKLKTS